MIRAAAIDVKPEEIEPKLVSEKPEPETTAAIATQPVEEKPEETK
jgi:hypothetical protein